MTKQIIRESLVKMNQEIKFRCWDGERMHTAFDLTQNPLFWWEDNYDYPLMQFTGSKDKYGKEIYDCDILMFDNGYCDVVRFERGAWRWNKRSGVLFNFKPEKNLSIIGNKYENKNLLN